MSRLAIVELHKEELKFSAGHFMLLSATQRETVHGHDYQISVLFKTTIKNNGLAFDCRYYKDKLTDICKTLDYRFLLPTLSEYLRLEEQGEKWVCHFNQETLIFNKNDAILLPICNVTLEELSNWFLEQLLETPTELTEHHIQSIQLTVYNGRGESGATHWDKQTSVDRLLQSA